NDLDIDDFEEDGEDDEELEDNLELAVVPAGAQLTGDRIEDAKRTHHNRLEKRRRQSLRASYQRLLHALPASPSGSNGAGGGSGGGGGGSGGGSGAASSNGCGGVQTGPGLSRDKASRAQILQRAVDYIKELQSITRNQSDDLARIDRENEVLSNELEDLEQAVASANQLVNQDDLPPSPPTSPETDQDAEPDYQGGRQQQQQVQHPVPMKRMKYSG
ncbi:hypothetical protein BOX15_Mlig010536g5, partial [Macrostomum lignano]